MGSYDCKYDRDNLPETLARLSRLSDRLICPHISYGEQHGIPVLAMVDSWCGCLGQDGEASCPKGSSQACFVAASNYNRDTARVEVDLHCQEGDFVRFAMESENTAQAADKWRTTLTASLTTHFWYAKDGRTPPVVPDVRFLAKRDSRGERNRAEVAVTIRRFLPSDATIPLGGKGTKSNPLSVYLEPKEVLNHEDRAKVPFATAAAEIAVPKRPLNGSDPVRAQDGDLGENRPHAKVVVVTALPVEYAAMRQHLDQLDEVLHDRGSVYETGTLQAKGGTVTIALLEVGRGTEGAAVEVERAIEYFSPSAIVLVGIAGGIKDVDIGDVIVGRKIYGYQYQKQTKALYPRGEVFLAADALIQRSRAVARGSDWRRDCELPAWLTSSPTVIIEPLAAGNVVVASEQAPVAKLLRKSFSDAVGVEMEALGVLMAAHKSALPGIVVRGVADLLKGEHAIPERERQKLAATTAAAFARELICEMIWPG